MRIKGVLWVILGAVIWPLQIQAQSLDAVDFSADSSVIDEEKMTIVMNGNVHLASSDMELKANQVVVQLQMTGPNGDEVDFDTMNATGGVWGRYQDITITSDTAEYKNSSQYAVFRGGAKVTQGGNTVSSSEVRMNLERGVYELVGGVRGKITGSF